MIQPGTFPCSSTALPSEWFMVSSSDGFMLVSEFLLLSYFSDH